MADELGTLLRRAADADLEGIELTRPDADGRVGSGTTRGLRWLAAAAIVAAVAGSGWWMSRPSGDDVQVGGDGSASTAPVPAPSDPTPAGRLTRAVRATMASAWHATLRVDGGEDTISFQPPDRYRAGFDGGASNIWIGERHWMSTGPIDGAAAWSEVSGSTNPLGRLFAALADARLVGRRPDGRYTADVDPRGCLVAVGAIPDTATNCTLVVTLDGDWMSRVDIPSWDVDPSGTQLVVLELTPAESPVVIEEPDVVTVPTTVDPTDGFTTSVVPADASCSLVVHLRPDAPADTAGKVGAELKRLTELGGDADTVTALGRAAMAIEGVASVEPHEWPGCQGLSMETVTDP